MNVRLCKALWTPGGVEKVESICHRREPQWICGCASRGCTIIVQVSHCVGQILGRCVRWKLKLLEKEVENWKGPPSGDKKRVKRVNWGEIRVLRLCVLGVAIKWMACGSEGFLAAYHWDNLVTRTAHQTHPFGTIRGGKCVFCLASFPRCHHGKVQTLLFLTRFSPSLFV